MERLRRRPGRALFAGISLTLLTLYWVTETITPSMRDYFDNRGHGKAIQAGTRVQVSMGFANFDKNYVSEGGPPRE